MIIFVKLLLAHLIGDFILQSYKWVADKEIKKHKSIYLYAHIFLHGILAWILIGNADFGRYALALAILHGIIDVLKLSLQKDSNRRLWFVSDQILHICVIGGIALLYSKQTIDFTFFDNKFWIVTTGLLLLTKPTSIVIKIIISIWTPTSQDGENSLVNAGNYIGILERLFVFGFILTGHFEAIGFLLGAKSIFRFGDLMEAKERKLTEYVLIGTLLSFGIAMLTGLLVQVALLQTL